MEKRPNTAESHAGFRWYDAWPIVLVLIGFVGFLWMQTTEPPVPNRSLSDRGLFGDSFGVLSALFNGLAFAGLIITITLQSRELRLQREELSATREEMRGQKEQLAYQSFAMGKQNFEGTFFRLLQMVDERASMLPDPMPGDLSRRGRGGFVRHVEQLRRVQQGAFTDPALSREQAKTFYEGWFKSAAPELSSYFQLLHEILVFVDATKVGVQKAPYAALVRAALSPAERTLLFYHGLFGIPGGALATLLKQYEVLGSIDPSIPEAHRQWYA